MGLFDLFSETPDILAKTTGLFSNAIPILIVIMLLIGIIYWLKSLLNVGKTEIRVYKRP